MVGIGFFAPLPLAMMMPFMAGQSMIMGDAFGKAYQYGKRKISAMSNEEFNKLTPQMLATQLQTDYMSMIPSLKASVVASRDFQQFIIQELGQIIKDLPPSIINAFGGNEQGQKPFDELQIPQNYQPPQKHELLIKIEQALSGLGAGASTFLTVPAVAAEEYNIPGQTFTQAEQDIQDNPPSNVPITISSLTDKELRTAYSDSLSNRLGLTAKQKQQLTLEYKKRFRNDTTKSGIISSTGANTANTDSANYQNEKTTLMQEVLRIKRLIPPNPQGARMINKVKGWEVHLEVARKRVINLITKYRNIPSTKAMANSDWNNRIWK